MELLPLSFFCFSRFRGSDIRKIILCRNCFQIITNFNFVKIPAWPHSSDAAITTIVGTILRQSTGNNTANHWSNFLAACRPSRRNLLPGRIG